MGRGIITKEIKIKAEQLLGVRDLSQKELRLMPYIQYLMMNGQRIDPAKISSSERDILSRWREKGWIEGGAAGMGITKEFWDAINEILWMGYVNPTTEESIS